MDASTLLGYAHEFAFMLGSFVCSLAVALWWGRQTVINLICALYLSLFLFTNFPYLERIIAPEQTAAANALISIGVFGIFVTLCLLLMNRVMPREYLEGAFESFPKKILLATALAVLVILICYTVLPVDTFLTPQPGLLGLLTDGRFEFWWLVIPLVAVAIN